MHLVHCGTFTVREKIVSSPTGKEYFPLLVIVLLVAIKN